MARTRVPASHAAGIWPAAAILAATLVVSTVMSWPFVSYRHLATASYAGDARLIIWTLAWDNHAVLSGQALFDSNLFYPSPDSLRYNEHLFGLSLFTLPLAAAGASPILAYNLVWLMALPAACLSAYALLRRLRVSRTAAFIGSLPYAFSYYVMLHVHGHLHLVWTWLFPVSLLCLERWFDRPSLARLAAWTAAVIVQSLTSWYLAVMVLLANAILLIVIALDAIGSRRTGLESGGSDTRFWASRGGHLIGAAVLIAACLWPFARHYDTLRSAPYEAARESADLVAYLVPPQHTLAGHWWLAQLDRRPRWIWGERTLFAGWLTLLLAAAGLIALARGKGGTRRAWAFPALTVIAFLLSLGPAPPLFGGRAGPFSWLAAMPGMAGFRAPARFALLVMLGLSGLVALGVSAAERRLGSSRRLLVLAVVPFMLAEWFVLRFPTGTPQPEPIPAIYRLPEVRSAHAIVSLPIYRGTPGWFYDADYLYYSTAHWRPIVNGFGRAEPAGHAHNVSYARAFPGPNNAKLLRSIGVQFVVLHGGRYPDRGHAIVADAMTSPEYRLVARIDDDYLFEVN